MAPIKSRKICIIAGMFCSAAFTLVVPQATTSMTAVLLIGMALFCIHFAGTSCWGLIHVAVASRMTASVGSIQNFASFICASFAPIITGFIVDTTHSFRLALIICGCVTAAGAWRTSSGSSADQRPTERLISLCPITFCLSGILWRLKRFPVLTAICHGHFTRRSWHHGFTTADVSRCCCCCC